MASPKEILKAARDTNPDILTNLPSIAVSAKLLDGFDPADPATLTTRSVILEPVVHPLLKATMDLTTATKRSEYSWSFGLGEDTCDPSPLITAIAACEPGTIVPANMAATTKGPSHLDGTYGHTVWNRLSNTLAGTNAAWVFGWDHGDASQQRYRRCCANFPTTGPGRFGAFTVGTDGRSVYLKVVTHFLCPPDGYPRINLNLWAAGRQIVEPRAQIAAEAIAVLDWCLAEGLTVIDADDDGAIARLRRTAARSIAVWPAAGRPAEAVASVGRKVPASIRDALGVEAPEKGHSLGIAPVVASQVAAVTTSIDPDALTVHPAIADVAEMSVATPVDDDRLRDYQREVVGLHLATSIGFANTLAPGLGKTICTLEAMRRKADTTPGWRGMVIVEANVRDQWSREATQWFPTATVVTIDSRDRLPELTETLSEAGTEPVLVIVSYALASTAAEAESVAERELDVAAAKHELLEGKHNQLMLFADETTWADALGQAEDDTPNGDSLGTQLLAVTWNDIVADEAVGLRNPGSKLSAALWALRARSEVAVALTGTPIVRSLDDLGRILSWCRNDRDMFYGHRLDKEFDVADAEQLQAFMKAIGPLVFRRDKSEIASELPDVEALVVPIEPSAAERALATAARDELKRVYQELVKWMEVAEVSHKDDPEFAEVRAALSQARGAWLGGTQLARMASSDPAALIGSESAAAALLASQGLVDAATATTGSKRAWATKYCTEQIANGEKILIFTEFATVAKGLIEDLTEAGLRVGAVLGGGGAQRDRDVRAFQAGDLDLLVCTSAGERGLNLQVASHVIHYDLAWTPDSVAQRAGRAERIGATASRIKVVFPIMSGTIEERIAALVVARAVQAMQALDVSRGVNATDTDMGRALGGLALEVDANALKGKRESTMLQITQELFANR